MSFSFSQKFRIQVLLFFAAIFVSQYFQFFYFPGIFFGMSILSFMAWKIFKHQETKYVFFVLLGLFWGTVFPFLFPVPIDVSSHIGTPMRVQGTIVSYPEMRKKDIRFYAEINSYYLLDGNYKKVSTTPQIKKSQEKILMLLPRSSRNIEYGNVFSADVSFVLPTSINPKEFNYRKYLFEQNVRVMTKNPRNFIISEKKGGLWIFRVSQNIRNFFLQNVSRHLPKTHSDIAMGMTLGSKSQLPKNVRTWFKNSGLQHILVVSGTNVTLLFFLILYLLAPFGKKLMFFCAIFTLVFFVLVSGADPPVLRAAIMGFFLLFSSTIGRFPDLRNFLLIAAIILGIFNPLFLQKSVSFFLSFIAMSGLVLLTPVLYLELKKFLGKIFSKKILLFFASTISAQISVFPVIGYFFGSFPLGGFFSNIIVDPFVPFVMGGTFLTGLFSSIPFLGEILGFFLEKSISFILLVAKFFSSFLVFSVSKIMGITGILFFLGFYIWAMISKKYEERYWTEFFKKNV